MSKPLMIYFSSCGKIIQPEVPLVKVSYDNRKTVMTQNRLSIVDCRSESSVFVVNIPQDPKVFHANRQDLDQTGLPSSLIRVFPICIFYLPQLHIVIGSHVKTSLIDCYYLLIGFVFSRHFCIKFFSEFRKGFNSRSCLRKRLPISQKMEFEVERLWHA